MKTFRLALTASAAALLAGCTPTIKTQNEVTVKPIQITLDVNLKVDEELNRELADDNAKAPAGSERELRRARRNQITAWKIAGLLGEDNRGLLAAPTSSAELQEAVRNAMEAENADRQAIFRRIAEKQNITPESVGRRMAERMADRAVDGTWIQTRTGEWMRKGER